ncbi:MAG: dihydrolipoyllysine-residue succinyltransferase [Actinobacteria bacterium]|nr:dihydrolipoyllysine-residue succinyltransferase [Actinomycetota bacterium]
MKVDMVMPQMGESIAEGTIVKWLKVVGDPVQRDEIILEISTDKVDSEIPSSESGVLAEILVQEGETVDVGTVIARISTDGEGVAAGAEQAVEQAEEKAVEPVAKTSPANLVEAKEERPLKFLSPLVKKIARENNIPLEKVQEIAGTGANGRVTKKDILNFIESEKTAAPSVAPQATPPVQTAKAVAPTSTSAVVGSDNRVDIIPMDVMRKKIAAHMVLSKSTSAHVTSVAEVDMTRIINYRNKVKKEFEAREGVKLTFTAFFIDAAVHALKEFPLINSSIDGDNILQKEYINIGFAVGMEKGLIVPVIKNADQLNLLGIARGITDLANRARTKKLKPDDVQGGTFSMTNIGTFGNLFGTPIINQPQVAILGTGAIKKRPVVINDAIAIRSMMYISLTYDHRIIDGLYGGSFLQRVVQILENYEIE